MTNSFSKYSNARKREPADVRLDVLWVVFLFFGLLVTYRLIFLMVVQHSVYEALAVGSREVYNNLTPKRGNIYYEDSRTGERKPAAMNLDYFLVYADTREIKDDITASSTANKLAEIFGYDEEKKTKIFTQLNKRTDPYEQIEKKVNEETVEKLKALNLPSLGFIRKAFRAYPEDNLSSVVTGFVGQDENGTDVGRYGIEGYWQDELAGTGGFSTGAKSAVGGWISVNSLMFKPAVDGADLVLTIDRALQYNACEKLRQAMFEYKATSAALVLMNPKNGAILAMCSLPDFDPNNYGKVESADSFNNSAVFRPYEPGSIFKPIVMSAGLNEGLVSPNTPFFDSGSTNGICFTSIKNANDKSYQNTNMTGVLENSINTGMVYVAGMLGRNRLTKYIQEFGFGTKTGIELDSESPGTVNTLLVKKKTDKLDCDAAVSSFGQSIMVTPIQMATAFSALVNGGILFKPFIVKEIDYADGRVQKIQPREIKRVISNQSSLSISSMLVSVVENGHSINVKVPGYYLGGKTGTAQIAGVGGYSEETNQSFVGFGPAEDPKFVLLIKFEKPQRAWADSTAAPVFKDIAQFVLQYYQIPPTR